MDMKRIIGLGLVGWVLSGMLCAQPAKNVENVSNQVMNGVGSIVGAIQQRQASNAAATLLYGEEGREADGYVVARGIDGYYSVWSTTNEWWQIMEPSSSTILNIILYDARACVIHRWLQSKWCIVDLEAFPDKKQYNKNKAILGYKYDDMKCVGRNAPIAVGKKKGKKMLWGLVTRNPESGEWRMTVSEKENWARMDIFKCGEEMMYARALRQGYATLYALDGSIIAEGAYEDLNIFDGVIEAKQNGQWTQLHKLEILPNYLRKDPEPEPEYDPLVPTRDDVQLF